MMKKYFPYLSLFLSSVLSTMLGMDIPVSATDDWSRINFMDKLEQILAMDDSSLKVTILTNLAFKYVKEGKQEKALEILTTAKNISLQLTDTSQQIASLNQVAQSYEEIGHRKGAIASLELATEKTRQIKDKSLQKYLLLNIALEYQKLEKTEIATEIYKESQIIQAKNNQAVSQFPFQEKRQKFQLGLSTSINSFRDTTATFGFNTNYEKQWEVRDVLLNGAVMISYDSDRDSNKFRPTGLINSVYRRHFDSRWSFFTNSIVTANQELFASQNDDEDLSILGNVLLGGGYNLWRGKGSNSVDLQIGLGGIYEYDFFDGENRRNQVSPALGILLQSRGLKLGKAEINNIIAIVPSLSDLENYTITSDSNISIPLSKKWFFTNRLFIRYRNQLIYKNNPKVQFFFSTGFQYKF